MRVAHDINPLRLRSVMSIVDWTDSFPTRTGLDQLGMRLASEGQYTQLVDYTTTVTWRPRYYSFLAWATRRAFDRASGVEGVERRTWKRTVRQLDYLIAAATLAGSPSAPAIIGSEKLGARVKRAAADETLLIIGDDHVGDGHGTGSLEVYGGPMSALGLLTQKDGVFGPTPLGRQLADAFEACAASCGIPDLSTTSGLDVQALRKVAEACGLDQLGTIGANRPTVVIERDLLRDRIVDWSRFEAHAQVRWRIQSIGLVLACHRLAGKDPTTLATFREAILTGGVRGKGALSLSPGFDEIRGYWRLYQAHAHLIFALESLLALALQSIELHAPRRLVPRGLVLDSVMALVRLGGAKMPAAATGLAEFWAKPLRDVLETLDTQVRAGWNVERCEPALAENLRRLRRDNGFKLQPEAAHDAALLLLWSLARLRALGDEVSRNWLGQAATWRRAPTTLVAHVNEAHELGLSTTAYLRQVLDDLVLRQHTTNAYRKLADQEGRSTALFQVDGPNVELVENHYPGTTNPRFDNASFYLSELGYLTGDPLVLSPDGLTLLELITERSSR